MGFINPDYDRAQEQSDAEEATKPSSRELLTRDAPSGVVEDDLFSVYGGRRLNTSLYGDIGQEYLDRAFNYVPPPPARYDKNKLLIGRSRRTGKPYFIDISESLRMLILGRTRSGKSFLLRAMADRVYKAGCSVVFLPDVKHEFWSSVKPVQHKFRHLLGEREKPTGMPVVALRPTFFYNNDGGTPPPECRWFSVDFARMSQEDFFTMLNVSKMTANQQNMMTQLFDLIKQNKKAGVAESQGASEDQLLMDDFSQSEAGDDSEGLGLEIEDIISLIDSLEDYTPQQRGFLKNKFAPLLKSNFSVPEHRLDLVQMLRERQVPTINMEYFDSFGRHTAINYPDVFFNIVYRMVVDGRRDKNLATRIPRLWIFVDEMTRFVPLAMDNSASKVVAHSVDVDTRYGIDVIFATQQLAKVPDAIYTQCKFIFLPHNSDVVDIAKVLKDIGIAKPQTASIEAGKLKRRCKRFDWMVFSKNDMSVDVISLVAPLSFHMETTD